MADITINGNEINLSSTSVEIDHQSRDASRTNYVYIQGEDSLSAEQKAELSKLHVTVQEYVADKTYLCRYTGTDLDVLRQLPFVRISNVFHRSLKTAAELKAAVETRGKYALFKIDIALHDEPDKTAGDVAQEIVQRNIATQDMIEALPAYNKVIATVQGGKIEEIEKIDSVNRIEEVSEIALCNNHARALLRVDYVVNATKCQGEGQLIAVADSGFDMGSIEESKIHPAFAGKVSRLIAVGRAKAGDTDDPIGHGTHVCGSIVGEGLCNDPKLKDQIRGTAPKARLIVQSLLMASGKIANQDPGPNFMEAYALGARVHSNSWSEEWLSWKGQRPYSGFAESIDSFVFENPDMVICVAAGNDGQQPYGNKGKQIGSLAAAKNCITVAASLSTRPTNGREYCPTFAAPKQPPKIAAFSSRGPTAEGRMKPDITAPGVAILSPASRRVPVGAALRTKYGVCADEDWLFSTGTSMATPLIAGCCAVLREALQKQRASRPSAALIKALLINGAQFTGEPRDAVPNPEQGFGHANLDRSMQAINVSPGSGFADVDGEKALTQESRKWSTDLVQIPVAAASLEVTLAYSDRKGTLLQNDLNLIVTSPDGSKKHGNMGSSQSQFDSTNNVEKVIWFDPPDGKFNVTVEAVGGLTRLNEAQAFAVVWSTFTRDDSGAYC